MYRRIAMNVKTKFEVGDKVGFKTWQFKEEKIGKIKQTEILIKHDKIEIYHYIESDHIYRTLEEKIYLIE